MRVLGGDGDTLPFPDSPDCAEGDRGNFRECLGEACARSRSQGQLGKEDVWKTDFQKGFSILCNFPLTGSKLLEWQPRRRKVDIYNIAMSKNLWFFLSIHIYIYLSIERHIYIYTYTSATIINETREDEPQPRLMLFRARRYRRHFLGWRVKSTLLRVHFQESIYMYVYMCK